MNIPNPNDAVAIAPHLHKVVLENEKVRVLDVVVPPGSRTEMHNHPANVIIVVDGGTLQMSFPDGSSKEVTLAAGAVSYSTGSEHIVENKSLDIVRVYQIELKN